jgi:hypothetical protein
MGHVMVKVLMMSWTDAESRVHGLGEMKAWRKHPHSPLDAILQCCDNGHMQQGGLAITT